MGIILAVSRTVCRRRGNALPVLLLLLSLAVCLVVTDTVPQWQYLFGLLLTFGLLLLTDGVRRESGGQASRLSAAVAAPLAAALALLFYCFPQSSYVNNTQALREDLLATLNGLPQMIQAQGMDLFSGLRPREKVEKCNGCIERIKAGLQPACVHSCPTGALTWRWAEDDEESSLSRLYHSWEGMTPVLT